MKLADRTTREDNHKNQIANIKHDQNSMSVFLEKLKKNLHQIKSNQIESSYISFEKIWDLSSICRGERSANKGKGHVQNLIFVFENN